MTAAMQRAMTAREWGLLVMLSLLWGGSFFFVGVAVKELPPLTLVALRVGLAAALLWAGAPLIGVASPRNVKAAAALAVLGFGNNACPSPSSPGARRTFPAASPRSSMQLRRSSPCSPRMNSRRRGGDQRAHRDLARPCDVGRSRGALSRLLGPATPNRAFMREKGDWRLSRSCSRSVAGGKRSR